MTARNLRLGKLFRVERKRRGWTLFEVARKLGDTVPSVLSRIENGRVRQPDSRLLARLARLYGRDLRGL